jgi:uncharacterized membrane protein
MKKIALLVIIFSIVKCEVILFEVREDILEDFSSKLYIAFTAENVSSLTIKINNVKNVESDICYIKDEKIECKIPTLEKKTYYLNVTKEKINYNLHRLEISISEVAKKGIITIILPQGSSLKEKKEELVPQPKQLSTDGKRIYLIYEFQEFQTFFTSFGIERVLPTNMSVYIIAIVIVVVISISIFVYFKFESFKKYKEFLVLLSENERKVIEILRKNPKIDQKKIVELSNLSKAEISKIISSFKQRGIVEVEKRGRNNIVKLIKKF